MHSGNLHRGWFPTYNVLILKPLERVGVLKSYPRYHWDCAPQLPLLRRSRMFVERFELRRVANGIEHPVYPYDLQTRIASAFHSPGKSWCT